jgi:fatty acid desaturase
MQRGIREEWPTLLALVLVYAGWALATTWLASVHLWLGIPVAAIAAAGHSSLTHELCHGHPTRFAWLNGLLAGPALGLFIPYLRFRDTHLAHHRDENLTDPYDDPESNYVDAVVWAQLPAMLKVLLRFNNTLAGRMLLGPLIGQVTFIWADLRAIMRGEGRVLAGWLLHVPAVGVVVWWAQTYGQMPLWAYLVQAYLAMSILKIRTFLEHRAFDETAGRTVVIEQKCPLAWLFLFNSFHIVHHSHPGVAWHRLPGLYFADRERYLTLNHGYVFSSYAEVFRRHFLRAKDCVPHPLWSRGD